MRWATPRQQSNNRKTTRWVEWEGRRMSCADWEREKGFPKGTIRDRIVDHEWSVAEAMSTPVGPRGKPPQGPFGTSREDLEAFVEVLRECGGSQELAARKLGVDRYWVRYRVEKARGIGLEPATIPRGRPEAIAKVRDLPAKEGDCKRRVRLPRSIFMAVAAEAQRVDASFDYALAVLVAKGLKTLGSTQSPPPPP